MTNLYNHQKVIIDADPKKCGLWLGTGSGKTRTALMLARGNTLVICPKTQKEDMNWEREHSQIGTLPCILNVVSKEKFRSDWERLSKMQFDTIIIDEAHTVLGATPNIKYVKREPVVKTSQLFEALDKFIQAVKPERLYLVTATITKSPMTVWAAAKLLGKNFNFYEWRNAFYIRLPVPGREIWAPKKDSPTKDKLARVVRSLGYVGRLSDYFDVPDQVFKTIHIELTENQKKRLKELPLEFPDPIVLVGKKHQVENGVLAGDEFNEPEVFENGKLEKLIELAEEFPRMVVFARYSAQIEAIRLAMEGIGKKVFVLQGATKDRGELIAMANKCEDGVFIAQSQVSAGWELPEWPVMVFASLDYSIVNYEQGIGRVLRANALKKNLYIHLVVKGGIDEAVYKAILDKKDFSERVYLKL